MRFDDIFDVLGGLVLVALATTLVTRPGTARVVNALGDSFAKALTAAQAR